MMRIAYPVSVAMGGVLPRTPLLARGRSIILQLPADMADLANERLVGRMKALGKLLNLEPKIETI
jgi:exopolyphosphatase/guanosine-5'-triphosphate,3'-diphosphate pyrophosphatase